MKGYYFQISNGLLTSNHRKRMGSAVWEFMWLLDRMTSISEEGIGKVLGGRPITLEEIGSGQVLKNTVSENIAKLEREGYISVLRTGRGLIISVNKAQKKFGRKVEKGSEKHEGSENHDSSKTMTQGSENHDSIYIDNTVDNTITSPDGDVPKKTSKEKNIKLSPALAALQNSLDMKKLGSLAIPLNENGKQQVELSKTQKEIIALNTKYPELKQIRAEYKQLMDLDGEDGFSENSNLKAWATLYDKKFKKDKNKLMEFLKKIPSHKFWSTRATSGVVILTNYNAIKKGDAIFTQAKKEDDEPIGITANEFMTQMFIDAAEMNGTTPEIEKQKWEEEQIEYKRLKAEGKV